MELPRHGGRRGSTYELEGTDAVIVNTTTTGPSPRIASSPFLGAPPSPNIGSSPRLGSTPRMHGRKDSLTSGAVPPTPASLWSSVFGGTAKQSSLPSYGPGSNRTPRPFYDGRSMDGRSPSPLILIRNIVLRPLYVLGRRGPLLPLFAGLVMILFYITYSTSPSSQSVKLKMQGAVGPYIPQRAAEAINWRGKQQPWDADAPPMKREPSVKEAIAPAGPPPPAELPPPRPDSRIPLEEGKVHPIPMLMRRAKEQWEGLKGRQSKTFAEAVTEYVRRNGRRPPKGFDKWYAFAKAHKVLMIDEFDLIDKDLLMYRAFKPSTFRARVAYIPKFLDTLWTIRVRKGKVKREGQLAEHDRAKGVEFLMQRFAHLLPDMTVIHNGHDGARTAVAADERERLETLAKEGKYDDDEAEPFEPKLRGQFPHWGMPVFCPPGSAVRAEGFDYGWAPAESTGYEMPPLEPGTIGSLVDSLKGYMNICDSPQYRHFHATSSWVYQHHPTPVVPLFTPGVQVTLGDVHGLIVEQLDLEAPHDPTWEERPFTSLQWRGQTSGPLWEKTTPWRTTQRARLHLLSHQETGSRKITITGENDVMRSVEVPNYRVNPLFLDTGMIGPAVQCIKEDGTCDEMFEVFGGYDKRISFDRASLYKYVLDVDGNSWSGRFRRLMLSNAAVVKATIFPEFWTDWAIPWLHYIPMQVDYSDMWDIMAFFRGGLNGEGAHDDLGKEIAEAGKEWVRLCYRWADLEAYQFRLLLEYGRLYNDEESPGSNDFTGDGAEEPVWDGPVKLD